MSIKKKLAYGFTTILLIFVISSSFVYYQIDKVQQQANEIAVNWMPSVKIVGAMNGDALNFMRFLYGFVLEPDKAAMDQMEKKVNAKGEDFEKDRKIYEPMISSPEEKQIYEQMMRKWNEYQQRVPQIKTYARNSDFTNANKEFVAARPIINEVDELLQKLVDINAKGATEATAAVNEASKSSKILLMIAAIISVISGALIAVLIAISIIKPLGILEKELKKLVERGGDLTQAIEIKSRDEIGELARTVNAFLANLRSIMSQVLQNSQQVAAASQQLTASAEQSALAANQVAVAITEVAKGAESQFKESDEASAVVEQMSAGVEEAAANANNVSGMADKTSQAAKSGSDAVGKAVQQMGAIAQSSQLAAAAVAKLNDRSMEIGQIVDTISGIAGQTNLLALNAAIEAARAGEQGKGFAVVAEEVRKLAEQSQEAAKRIAVLIGEIKDDTDKAVVAMNGGAHEVKLGTEVVNTAGQAFGEIQGLVDEVSSQIGDISATVQQIASGSQHIVAAVQSIATIAKGTVGQTQTVSAATEEQSASMEEIASSSQSLASLAQDLQNTINKFTV
ncbi:MAG TPA: HAMP domain-containing methyl-accepting chemotaxis protein [Negativicutes bacterium]